MIKGVFLVVGFIAINASAETRFESLIRRYDDGATQVLSPHVDISSQIADEQVSLQGGYAADVISSASSDVKSFASAGKISEHRNEYSAGLGVQVGSGLMGWSYVQSDENDYHSKAYSVRGTREFFDKNTTVEIKASFGFDHINSSRDKTFDQQSNSQNFVVGFSQVFSKYSIGEILFDWKIENGYLSSPYRSARVLQPDASVFGIPENHPKTRNRNALALKYNYFFSSVALAAATNLRFYNDSWDVRSITVEERLSRDIGKRLSLTLYLKGYQQSQASFYKDKYSADVGPFYTGNKTLANMNSYLIGLRPEIHVGDRFNFYASGEYYAINYLNHTDVGNIADPTDDKLLSLKAYIIGVGIDAKF